MRISVASLKQLNCAQILDYFFNFTKINKDPESCMDSMI